MGDGDVSLEREPARAGATALLVTELFPPAVGGSPVLFESIYGRLETAPVKVLTDEKVSAGPSRRAGGLEVVHRAVGTRQWGVAHRGALWHHVRVAREIARLSRGGRTLVHAARALPEGLAASLARAFLFGPRFLCWALGEEVAYAQTSRELGFLLRRVYARAELIVAICENTRSIVAGVGVPRERIRIVYPGVDTERFHPRVDGSAVRARYARPGEPLLATIGRLQRRKGHDLAIEAVARLRDEGVHVRYVIAGTGEERPRLEALVAERGVGDRVVFAGGIPPDEIPAFFAACDVFVHPNRIDGVDVEGFGIVFLEAAAVERPTIGGRNGGVPEAVADGETGLLVSGVDAGELAAAIRRLVESPELRARLGALGRARVLREFTWARSAASLAAIHEEVAAR